MAKFTTIEVAGIKTALLGMREPMQSFNKQDSSFENIIPEIGPNDLDLTQRLSSTGSDSDNKFLRQTYVSAEITAPAYFLGELDTYKVGTTRDSSSLQHKGMSRDYELGDFTIDDLSDEEPFVLETWENNLKTINHLRALYKETKDYKYFRMMRQLIPMGYNYTAMWSANYAVVRNMYRQRKNHRLKEWNTDFVEWVKSLPYAEELIMYGV